MKRDGVKVRHRSGFFGISDKKLIDVENKSQTKNIYKSVLSPFGKNDISLSLNTAFVENNNGKKFLRSHITIGAKNLKFTEQKNGSYLANFKLITMIIKETGIPVEEVSTNFSFELTEELYEKARRKGIIYTVNVPIKKSGAYQFRVALQDTATTKIGTASQFVEIPNLKKNRLAVSTIILENYTVNEWKNINNLALKKSPDVETASRRFKKGTILRYDYIIYNAKSNPSNLEIKARLFKDGKVFLEGKPSKFDTKGQENPKKLTAVGAITLGKNLASGDYVLQVIVEDKTQKKKKFQKTHNWIDFEVVE